MTYIEGARMKGNFIELIAYLKATVTSVIKNAHNMLFRTNIKWNVNTGN